MQQETPIRQEYIQGSIGAAVDGRDLQLLNESKGWYREEKHGREVEVSDIAVQPAQTEGKYKMSAVIDGQVISHEISQKDYDKFLAVDDYHRMKLFSKIFNEVDMKTRPEANKGAWREDIRCPYRRCGGGVGSRTWLPSPPLSGVLWRTFQRTATSIFQARRRYTERCGHP